MNLDVLVFCAHPDDAEISMGGTIAKFAQNDLKVGIVDFTRGELGTRGSADIRQREAFQAAIILKVVTRENLHVPDGDIQLNKDNLMKAIIAIRRYKPKMIFAPYKNDRHPDHVNVSKLIKRAYFYAGLPKVKTFDKDMAQDSFRPKKLYYYMQSYMFEPSFIVDISDTYETKMNSIKAYATQFFDPHSTEPETFISHPGFIEYIQSRSQIFGFKIGKNYGEPFYCEEDTELDVVHQVKQFNNK